MANSFPLIIFEYFQYALLVNIIILIITSKLKRAYYTIDLMQFLFFAILLDEKFLFDLFSYIQLFKILNF